jgi:GT2 family glycosyltransferase
MGDRVTVSVIIVNWNTADYLVDCLESLFASTPKRSFEVIVVDNNSHEDVDAIKRQYPAIRLIKCGFNYGFAVATNIGFAVSRGDYVMTLNPDTLVYDKTIDTLCEELEKDSHVGLAIPVLRGKRVSKDQYSFTNLFFNSLTLRKVTGPLASRKKQEMEPFDVEFIGGTGYICRRSALSADGFFREDYFLFGEEFHLCNELRARGYLIRVVPAALIEHFTSVTFKNDMARLTTASRLGSALGWKIRRERWGSFLGMASGILLCIEHGAKLAAIAASKAVGRCHDPRLDRAAAQSRALLSSFAPIVLNQDRFIARVNEEAKIFFNEGSIPADPPSFAEMAGHETTQNCINR